MRWTLLLALAMPWAAHADTIYLCRAYSGGMFWSSAPCGAQQATIDRMVSVPDRMSWDQKVALGEAALSQARALTASSTTQGQAPQPSAQTVRHEECTRILDAIANLSSPTRLRPSGQIQDPLRQQLDDLEKRRQRLQC